MPALISGSIASIKVGTQTAFEEIDENGNIKSCKGLNNFLKTEYNHKPVYIFDNHNHAFAFWCQALINKQITKNALLIHVDQHKDTRSPTEYLSEEDLLNNEKVFNYTNTVLNVGNFIPPALHSGLVSKVINLDTEESFNSPINIHDKKAKTLQPGYHSVIQLANHATNQSNKHLPQETTHQFTNKHIPQPTPNQSIILDIDLDIFAHEMDYISNKIKLKRIRELLPRADLITIATSPYFIDQKTALKFLKMIFEI